MIHKIDIGVGIGDVVLGKEENEIIEILGDEYEKSVYEGEDLHYLCFYELGISTCFQGNILNSIFIYSGLKGGCETGKFKRFEGIIDGKITMDSNYQEVMLHFGKPMDQGEYDFPPIPSQWISYDGIAFDFIIETGEIIFMTILSPD